MSLEISASIFGWALYFVLSALCLIWFIIWYRKDRSLDYAALPLFLFFSVQFGAFVILNLFYKWVVFT
jgi:hypothetical protein